MCDCQQALNVWDADGSGESGQMQQSSWLQQFWVLSWRSWMHYIRNPADAIARLCIAVGIGVLTGLVFLHATTGQPADVYLTVCIT